MVDRATALVHDIEAIPLVLDDMAAADGLQNALRAGIGGASWTPRRVVLTGLGSSRFAALDIEADLRALDIDEAVEPASTDRPIAPSADTLLVAISSSGRTPEVVAAAERHSGASRVLAVTRDASSRLAGTADFVAVLPVEAEESGVATTTYVATMAVLRYLVAALGEASSPASLLAEAAEDARSILATRDTWLPPALSILREVEALTVMAAWSERGAAEQIALLFREAPRRSADVAETAEWLHTGVYTALPGSLALVIAGSPADSEVAQTIVGRTGQVIVIGGGADTVKGPDALLGGQVRSGAGTAHASPAAAVIPGRSPIGRFVGPALLAAELWRTLSR